MTNNSENGNHNWFWAIALVLLIAFLVIAFLCSWGIFFFNKGSIFPAIIVWLAAGIVTYYWIHAVINFTTFVHKQSKDAEEPGNIQVKPLPEMCPPEDNEEKADASVGPIDYPDNRTVKKHTKDMNIKYPRYTLYENTPENFKKLKDIYDANNGQDNEMHIAVLRCSNGTDMPSTYFPELIGIVHNIDIYERIPGRNEYKIFCKENIDDFEDRKALLKAEVLINVPSVEKREKVQKQTISTVFNNRICSKCVYPEVRRGRPSKK